MTKVFKRIDEREWGQIGLIFAFVLVQVWLDLEIPGYMSRITQLTQTPGSQMGEIWGVGGMMLLCALGSFAAAVIVGLIAARVSASYATRLRGELFSKVDSFSMEEIGRFSTASLITRSTNDVTQVQMLLAMGMQMVLKAPVMAIWALGKIEGKSASWTIATGATVGILTLMVAVVMFFVMPKFKKMQTLTDNLNRVTMENLTGLRVVRAYNAEGYQQEKFEVVNREITETQLFTSRGMAIMMPVMGATMSGLSLSIYWIGAHLISAAQVADKLPLFSDMVVFSSYAMQIIMSFMMVVMAFIMMPRAIVSARRIDEVLETETTIKDGGATGGLLGKEGEVEFNRVSFKYPDAAEYVLRDVSFSAKKGETVAFIGSTGSGKSTLINLVPRFFDATEGEVLVGGVNVKQYKLEALNDRIGYVPQRAVLFKGTVASNVAYGENGRDVPGGEQIQKAVRIAQGAEFVEGMEGQYDAEVSQGGANLSGGQKQRLAIARAVCRRPEVYIFDDSFSALDYRTDRELRSALKKETAGVTSLIVAQRIGTIMDADQIIVLDEGRIVGRGTHRELLNSCDVYREIAMSQLSEEELAV